MSSQDDRNRRAYELSQSRLVDLLRRVERIIGSTDATVETKAAAYVEQAHAGRALRLSLLEIMAEDDGTYEWCVRMAARVATLLSTQSTEGEQ